MELPPQFKQRIKAVHKGKGEEWLRNFNALIQYCEKRWSMRIMTPFQLSFNFTAPAILSDGTKVVLKLVVPSDDRFLHEVEALKHFNGNGIARLIDCELDMGIMILELITPGEKLASIQNDEKATSIICQVIEQLWMPVPAHCKLPTSTDIENEFRNICNKYSNGIGPFSKKMLQDTEALFRHLNSTIKQQYILHGDLHHYNILSSDKDSWIAIDPHGRVGEKEYDVIQMFWNNLPSENLTEFIEKRINILVNELNLNEERVLLWGICHSTYNLSSYIHDFGETIKDIFEVITIFKNLHKLRFGEVQL